MDSLLELASTERADELRLHVGKPPVLVKDSKQHAIEGPAITAEDAKEFLLRIANAKQRREVRERGRAVFFYKFRGSERFLVDARMEGDNVGFDII